MSFHLWGEKREYIYIYVYMCIEYLFKEIQEICSRVALGTEIRSLGVEDLDFCLFVLFYFTVSPLILF